ncbi:MAG: FG-GAP repeat domain-containing protein [Mariniblastus sp.]
MFPAKSKIQVLIRGSSQTSLLMFLCWVLLFNVGCGKRKPIVAKLSNKPAVELKTEEDRLIHDLVESEDLVLDLTPQLSQYASWVHQNSNQAADFEKATRIKPIFDSLRDSQGLQTADLDSIFSTGTKYPAYVTTAYWPIAPDASPGANDPWRPLQDLNAVWETVKFGVVSAEFDNSEKTSFTMHTKSEGRGRARNSAAMFGFKGYQDLTWTKSNSQWVLSHWKQIDFTVMKTQRPLFKEVLADVIVGDAKLDVIAKAQRSSKDNLLIAASKSGQINVPKDKYKDWTSAASNYLFPSVSVVDYDNDGFDDLFLTGRWGATQMLHNQGDGTFTEVTKDVGLYFRRQVNCALFADFDNDGDQDVVIGRPLERALYFQNENGVFTDVTDSLSDLRDLYFVTGISVSDVNRDGLLDVYLSTYAPLRDDETWGSQFLKSKELKLVVAHQKDRNRYLDLAGPSNILLMNKGNGFFKRVDFDETLSQWRRSFQSVWGDIDQDGDDDLYICNDFAPDAVLRNDTPIGSSEPVFTEVTEDVLLNKGIGFGMGASFGDFDSDGDLDLYVSNMFSKAGTRIIEKVKNVDPRTAAAAAGNFLFVNESGKFDQQAGTGDDQFHVNQVGWSYGGQWADFDNDGQLDLYVPSGYYTAPKEISTQVDT